MHRRTSLSLLFGITVTTVVYLFSGKWLLSDLKRKIFSLIPIKLTKSTQFIRANEGSFILLPKFPTPGQEIEIKYSHTGGKPPEISALYATIGHSRDPLILDTSCNAVICFDEHQNDWYIYLKNLV
jgi:hypothetical protein